MSLSKFGPFAEVFEKGELSVPGYLTLLGLMDDRAQIVMSRIERVVAGGDQEPWIGVLFEDPNWRPHLVGAVAMLLDDGPACCLASLWDAIDAGSWVTPQLVVSALFLDPDFKEAVRARIDNRCVVMPPSGLTPLERHSASGPAGIPARSAKLMASLLAVSAHVPSLSPWLAQVRQEPEVQDLLGADIDGSEAIADDWRKNLMRQFTQRGRSLGPMVV
jgi:hypothetical protein